MMNGGGVFWKWVAASLFLIMMAGAPSYIELLKAPSKAEVGLIRERQEVVLQRLAAIDVRLNQIDAELTRVRLEQEAMRAIQQGRVR